MSSRTSHLAPSGRSIRSAIIPATYVKWVISRVRGIAWDRAASIATWMTLGGLLILGAWVRFHQLAHKSLFADEVITVNNSIDYSLQHVFPHELTHRSVLYLSTHYAIQWLGVDEFSVRLVPAVLGTLGIAAMYLLGRTFFDRTTALFATLLLVLSSFHVDHSQFSRFYAGLLLFSLLAMFSLVRGVETNRRHYWLIFVIATTLNLYNHLFAALVLGAGAVWAIAVLAIRYWVNTDQAHRKETRQRFVLLVISGFLIVLLYTPAIANLGRTLTGVGEISVAAPTEQGTEAEITAEHERQLGGTSPATAGFNFKREFNQVLIQFRVGTDYTRLFHGSLFLLGLAFMVVRRKWQPITLFLLTGVLTFVFLKVITTEHFFLPKYVIYLLPLYLVTMAYGLVNIGRLAALGINRYLWPNRSVLPVLALAIAVLCLTPVAAIAARDLPGYYGFQRSTDARGTAHFVHNHFESEDGVVLLGGARGLGYRFYHAYVRDEGTHADHREVHRLNNLGQAERFMSRYERLWIIADMRSLSWADPELYRWIVQNSFIVPFNGYVVYLKQESVNDLTLDERVEMLEDAWRLSRGTYNNEIPIEFGHQLLARGEWKRAIELYAFAHEARSDRAAAERALASLYERRGDWTQARAVYSRSAERWPSDPSYRVLEGRTYVQLGQPSEALAAFRDGSKLADSPALELIARGDVALELEDYAQAVANYKQATQVEPENYQPWIILAQAHLLEGDEEAADHAYRRALNTVVSDSEATFDLSDLELSPDLAEVVRLLISVNDSNVLLEFAQVDLLRGRYDFAQLLAKRSVYVALVTPRDEETGVRPRQRPQVPFIVIRANLILGDIAAAANDRLTAETFYLEAAAWAPFDPMPLMRIAQLRAQEQKFEDALSVYQQALVLNPASPDIRGRLARTVEQLGNPEQAIEEYRAILEIVPKNTEYRLLLADALYAIGEVSAAEELYRSLVDEAESRPMFPDLAHVSGSPSMMADLSVYAAAFAGLADIVRDRALENARSLDNAIRLYDRGLRFNPDEVRLLVGRAQALQENRQFDRALEDLGRAISLEPESPAILLNMSDLYIQQVEFDHAEASILKVIEIDPTNYPARIQLANLYVQAEQFEKAESVLLDSIELDPNRSAAYRALGDLSLARGDELEAIAYYEEALERNRTHVPSMIALGDLLMERDESLLARYWYLRANEIEPDSDRVIRRLQRTS